MALIDSLFKVTVRPNGATHVNNPAKNQQTLCGRIWYFHCDLGTEYYCQACQVKLAKLLGVK